MVENSLLSQELNGLAITCNKCLFLEKTKVKCVNGRNV